MQDLRLKGEHAKNGVLEKGVAQRQIGVPRVRQHHRGILESLEPHLAEVDLPQVRRQLSLHAGAVQVDFRAQLVRIVAVDDQRGPFFAAASGNKADRRAPYLARRNGETDRIDQKAAVPLYTETRQVQLRLARIADLQLEAKLRFHAPPAKIDRLPLHGNLRFRRKADLPDPGGSAYADDTLGLPGQHHHSSGRQTRQRLVDRSPAHPAVRRPKKTSGGGGRVDQLVEFLVHRQAAHRQIFQPVVEPRPANAAVQAAPDPVAEGAHQDQTCVIRIGGQVDTAHALPL